VRKYKIILVSTICAVIMGGTSLAGELTDHQKLSRVIYQEAVETPTYADSMGTPKLVAKFIKRLKAAGFVDDDITVVDTAEGHQSLIVRYQGSDSNQKGIAFLGHMDVVTAYKKDWVLDPFTLTEKDGYFMGRGTADNKLGVVGILSTFIKLKSEGYVPTRDMVIMFTDDEETGMVSTKQLAKMALEKLNIEFAFNGDAGGGRISTAGKPLIYSIQAAEKTYYTVTLTVTNSGGHSSRPRKDNAIYQLAKALDKVESHSFKPEINEITELFMTKKSKSEKPEMAAAIMAYLKDQTDEKAIAILSDNTKYNALIRTTCVATMLSAGHAENALPQSAEATINCRIMPGTDPTIVHKQLEDLVGAGVTVAVKSFTGFAPASPMRNDVVAAVVYANALHYEGISITANMSAGGTDGKEFRALGIPVYGVGGYIGIVGDSSNAHGLNEKIRVKGFYKSLDHWERLMKYATGGVK